MNTFPDGCAAKFRCEGLLATGSYGAVYRARQLALDRPVAVKILRSSGDELAPERFAAEAKLTAALSHRNVVTVIDHGVDESVPWIAYELLPGRSLRDLPGALPWREAFAIGAQVAAGIEEAHRHGIMHRDIKPENILEAGPGWYKVADFGIAKWGEATYRTEHGMVLGTPAYMAPGALMGDPPCPAFDVYSIGTMLYELITGRLPFPDPEIEVMVARILESEPMPPSGLVAGLPPVVDRLVLLAMGRPPGALTTAAELRTALERALAQDAAGVEPTGPRTSRRTVAAARSVARVRARSRAGAAFATLLVCGSIGLLAAARRPVATPAPARSPAPVSSVTASSFLAELNTELKVAAADAAKYRQTLRPAQDKLLGGVENFEEAAPWLERALKRLRRMVAEGDRLDLRGAAWLDIEFYITDTLSTLGGAPSHLLPQRIDPAVRGLLQALARPSEDPYRRFVHEALEPELEDCLAHRAHEETYLQRRISAMARLLHEAGAAWAASAEGARHCLRLTTRVALLAEHLLIRPPERGPIPLPLIRHGLDDFLEVLDRYAAVAGHQDTHVELVTAITALASISKRPAVGDPYRAMARAYLRRLVPLTARGELSKSQLDSIAAAFPPGEPIPESAK